MKKTVRFAAALLALCLLLTPPGRGAEASLSEAVEAVSALGLLSGDGSGDLGLSRRMTRAEFTAMAVKAADISVGQGASSPYPDVPRDHWASGYVEAAVSLGLVTAFSDGTFRPEGEIKLAEGVSMALSLLGYGPEDFAGAYPSGQLALYRRLRLDRGVSASAAQSPLTRQDAVYLFYNLLSTRTKEGTPYIQILGYSLDEWGKPDLVALVNGAMEGPLVAEPGWRSSLPFTPGKVYRNGGDASLGDVQSWDVLYWNKSMDTLWAYGRRASGVIQAIAPSTAAPESVTVAGRTYAIESSAAAYDLSDLGRYRLGDTVTLLLGRSGGVAALAEPSVGGGEKVGLVVAAENASYPDGSGGSYTAQTVTLLAADGQTYQYQTRGGYQKGSLVRAAIQGDQVTLRGVSSPSLSGEVNREGTKLDRYTFASGAEILDISDSRGAVVSPSRLAGLSLDRGAVRYYSLNPQGEIETLILDDVTGDAYQYGMLTQMDRQGDTGRSYSYSYDIAGAAYSIPYTSTRYPAAVGPIQLLGDPANPDRISSLTSAGTGQLVGRQFTAGSQRYTLSDGVLVYEFRDSRYFLSSLTRAEESGAVLTAWYDKPEKEGGRIRVITVK